MKNRGIKHSDNWKTPKNLYDKLDAEFHFDFDPCPLNHDVKKWDGLEKEWGARNFINPPYSRKLKESFVKRAIEMSGNGKLCVMLLPVSTSSALFHDYILPNKKEIRFIRGRVRYEGVNTSGKYVIGGSGGMHDSMVVIFGESV
jgi:phage N-6-adenine-methyltransferase